MCLARCFVLASTRVEKGADSDEYVAVRTNRGKQGKAAEALLVKLGLADWKMTLADIPAFAKVNF